jgi:hypothetical protein
MTNADLDRVVLALDRKPRFELKPFAKLTVGSEHAYLVKGIIPRVGLVVAWGPPKCGKSFWAFDLAMHVALGRAYRGRRVHQGAVVYAALEGGDGFRARAEAFRLRHLPAGPGPIDFYLMTARINLAADYAELIRDIRAQLDRLNPVLVVLDTLNRSLAGSESDDKDMAAYIRAADAIRETFGCAVLIVHHCGVEGTRPRGHTSLTGAVDAQLAVKRDGADNVLVTVEWMKDGPEGDIIASRLEAVEVGTDEDGDPITSCVVEPVEGAAHVQRPRGVRLTKAAQTALRALLEAVDEVGSVPPASNHIPAGIRATTLDQWRAYAYRRGVSASDEPRARQTAFKRASEHLIGGGHVCVWDEHVWPTV